MSVCDRSLTTARFVKSTQPGIAASEGKVKFYALCESLKFRRGEIIVRQPTTILEPSYLEPHRTWIYIANIEHWFIRVRFRGKNGKEIGMYGGIMRLPCWIITVGSLNSLLSVSAYTRQSL